MSETNVWQLAPVQWRVCQQKLCLCSRSHLSFALTPYPIINRNCKTLKWTNPVWCYAISGKRGLDTSLFSYFVVHLFLIPIKYLTTWLVPCLVPSSHYSSIPVNPIWVRRSSADTSPNEVTVKSWEKVTQEFKPGQVVARRSVTHQNYLSKLRTTCILC